MFRELGGRRCISEALEDAAWLLALRREAEAAATLFAASEILRQRIGYPFSAYERRERERRLAVARSGADPQAFDEALARGRTLSIDAALDCALAGIGAGASSAQAVIGRRRSDLTRRELEVAELVARGMTNHQIAERLVIGERTVDTHVENILARLDLSTRAQVAVWVTERRMAARPT
jgi:non-specific serine/threonine protein kinase